MGELFLLSICHPLNPTLFLPAEWKLFKIPHCLQFSTEEYKFCGMDQKKISSNHVICDHIINLISSMYSCVLQDFDSTKNIFHTSSKLCDFLLLFFTWCHAHLCLCSGQITLKWQWLPLTPSEVSGYYTNLLQTCTGFLSPLYSAKILSWFLTAFLKQNLTKNI